MHSKNGLAQPWKTLWHNRGKRSGTQWVKRGNKSFPFIGQRQSSRTKGGGKFHASSTAPRPSRLKKDVSEEKLKVTASIAVDTQLKKRGGYNTF